jgi:pimeloyl-ACP methyl ester carboxylesterase
MVKSIYKGKIMLPHWTEGDMTVGGVRLHYTRTGDGSKPALVLAHGFSDSGLCWLPVARDLESDFDVILPDAHGHGLSARVQPGEALNMVANLAELIRGLGLNSPVIGGHSMGANVSSQVAARYPGLARALVLEDPGWRDPEPEGEKAPEAPRPNPYTEWLMGVSTLSVEAVMAKCRADNPIWPEVELRPWAVSKKQFDPNFMRVLNFGGNNWRDVARAIDCPTLLITADVDKGAIVSEDMARQAGVLNNRIRVAHLPGAGHSIRREQYEGFIQVVRQFLKNLPA